MQHLGIFGLIGRLKLENIQSHESCRVPGNEKGYLEFYYYNNNVHLTRSVEFCKHLSQSCSGTNLQVWVHSAAAHVERTLKSMHIQAVLCIDTASVLDTSFISYLAGILHYLKDSREEQLLHLE